MTKMSEVDHGVGYEFQSKMMKTYSFKTDQKPFKLVFPGKGSLDGFKAFLKNIIVVKSFSSSLCLLAVSGILFNVGRHPGIENHFSINGTIIG